MKRRDGGRRQNFMKMQRTRRGKNDDREMRQRRRQCEKGKRGKRVVQLESLGTIGDGDRSAVQGREGWLSTGSKGGARSSFRGAGQGDREKGGPVTGAGGGNVGGYQGVGGVGGSNGVGRPEVGGWRCSWVEATTSKSDFRSTCYASGSLPHIPLYRHPPTPAPTAHRTIFFFPSPIPLPRFLTCPRLLFLSCISRSISLQRIFYDVSRRQPKGWTKVGGPGAGSGPRDSRRNPFRCEGFYGGASRKLMDDEVHLAPSTRDSFTRCFKVTIF